MRTTVKLSELLDVFQMATPEGPSFSNAYVSRKDGSTYLRMDEFEDQPDDLPADLDDDTLYARVPSKRVLGLGQRLIFRFVDERAPDDFQQVRGIFSRRGAYKRFKDFLDERGLLEAWYAFEEKAFVEGLREWAEGEGFEVVEG
jgi:hypothetical protein